MFQKVAMLSIVIVLACSPWKANSDQVPPLARATDNFSRECKLALKNPSKNWFERLKAGRCGAWRDLRVGTEQQAAR